MQGVVSPVNSLNFAMITVEGLGRSESLLWFKLGCAINRLTLLCQPSHWHMGINVRGTGLRLREKLGNHSSNLGEPWQWKVKTNLKNIEIPRRINPQSIYLMQTMRKRTDSWVDA